MNSQSKNPTVPSSFLDQKGPRGDLGSAACLVFEARFGRGKNRVIFLNNSVIISKMLQFIGNRIKTTNPDHLPLRLRKAGRVWCGGARETH